MVLNVHEFEYFIFKKVPLNVLKFMAVFFNFLENFISTLLKFWPCLLPTIFIIFINFVQT